MIEIQLSPEEGNFGSTMFDDHHRESFVDESPNPPVEAIPDVEKERDVVEKIHDDQNTLRAVKVPEEVEEKKEPETPDEIQ